MSVSKWEEWAVASEFGVFGVTSLGSFAWRDGL